MNLEDEGEENHVEVEEEEDISIELPTTETPETSKRQNSPEHVQTQDTKNITGVEKNKDTETIIPITTTNDNINFSSKNTSNATSPILTSPVEKYPPLPQELSIKQEETITNDSVEPDTQLPTIKTPPQVVDNDSNKIAKQKAAPIIKDSVKVESKTNPSNNTTCFDNEETKIKPLSKCDCIKQRPLIDQITITDITEGDITVTVKECFTDVGFFFPR